MQNSNTLNILVINSNPDEIDLIAKLIDIQNWKVNFNSLDNGIEAINYLHKKGKYKNCVTPSLILLDLNLPKKSGFEVLQEIKTNTILKSIPVIILTNSNNDKDVIESYEHHANAYIFKPIDNDKFKEYITTFKEFWFNNVKLPDNKN
jgi:Response regulator containing a CheY-like receiver domain and an HD-GYP domain